MSSTQERELHENTTLVSKTASSHICCQTKALPSQAKRTGNHHPRAPHCLCFKYISPCHVAASSSPVAEVAALANCPFLCICRTGLGTGQWGQSGFSLHTCFLGDNAGHHHCCFLHLSWPNWSSVGSVPGQLCSTWWWMAFHCPPIKLNSPLDEPIALLNSVPSPGLCAACNRCISK